MSGSFSFQLSNIITPFQTSHQQASHWHGYYLVCIILNILREMSPKFSSEILAVAVRALAQGLPWLCFWIRPNQHAKPLSRKLSKYIRSVIRTFTNQERPTLVSIPNENLVKMNGQTVLRAFDSSLYNEVKGWLLMIIVIRILWWLSFSEKAGTGAGKVWVKE